jgi:hypothetical protein
VPLHRKDTYAPESPFRPKTPYEETAVGVQPMPTNPALVIITLSVYVIKLPAVPPGAVLNANPPEMKFIKLE